MDKIFAQFISPLVARMFLSDPTIDTYNFEYISNTLLPKQEEIFNPEMFDLLNKISIGQSIEINEEQAKKLLVFAFLFNNQELLDLIIQKFENVFDCNDPQMFIEQAMALQQLQKYNSELEFDMSMAFDEIATKFESIDKNKSKSLPKNILFSIIISKNLTVKSEDSLFDFIIDVFNDDDNNDENDKNDEYNLISFLEHVEIRNLSERKAFEYLKKIKPCEITNSIWENLLRIFNNDEKKS